MLERFTMRMLGVAFVIVVLLCAGIYFYAEWSNKRFMSELGAPPQPPVASELTVEIESEEVSTTLVEPTKFVSEDPNQDAVVSEPESVDVPELMDEDVPVEATELSEPASEFDAMPLLSAFGLPEEVTTLFDEGADEADFEEAEAYLVEEYGQSPEVEVIIDRLKQLSGGPVELDTLTGLFEAWIQVLPEEDRENRRQLMNVITQLNQAKALGADAEVSVEVHVVGDD
ncbi:MAG: hypothetical protein OYL97_24890 [Candidatus Poribacteria bacterium]|nr:hypothetical protein [Candidatus Poribacteria bacterium]MDE0470293.1 hypothetical protein [Candidatus Poribacteria bacterium]